MRFTSLSDPTDLARAYTSLEAVWGKVNFRTGQRPRERARESRLSGYGLRSCRDEYDLTGVFFQLESDDVAA